MKPTITIGLCLAFLALISDASGSVVVGNSGFETVVPIPYWPVLTYGDWYGNPATMVTAENSITPIEGTHMLKFTGGDPTANVWQMVDVTSLPAGSSVTLTADFNRAVNSASLAQIRISALNHGPPSNGNPEFDQTVIAILQQNIPANTWTPLSLTAVLPTNTVSLAIEVASGGPFTYADNVSLTPEPSSIALAAVALAGLCAWRWRRSPSTSSV